MKSSAKKLYRSNSQRLWGGVLSGVGEYADINPNIIRAGWILLTIFFTIAGILTYIALIFTIPNKRSDN